MPQSHQRKRTYDNDEGCQRKRSRFVDLEAEVSDEGEDVDDDDYDSMNDSFIETAETVDEDDGRYHRRVDKRRLEEDEISPEDIAKQFTDRYNPRLPSHFTGNTNHIPQRLLMPGVHDPGLWRVSVKPGRERDIVFSLMRKSLALEYTANPLQIISAFERDSLPGVIYVEARYPQQVQQACTGLVGVNLSRGVHIVPIDEMASLLMVKRPGITVTPGSWVRIRRGKYDHDLAQVVDITENGDALTVRCVPRIDLNPPNDMGAVAVVGGPKRKKHATGQHRQRLFRYAEVAKIYGSNAVSKVGQLYIFRGDSYKEGCLLKTFKLSSLKLEDVNPTLDEIAMFTYSDGELENGMMDFSTATESSRNAAISLFEPGERVEIIRGELAGAQGVVQGIAEGNISVTTVGTDLESHKISLSVRYVRKLFRPGDHVKVMAGKNVGETGLVVSVSENVVTFLGDLSMQEVSVFSKDLKEADGIGSGVKPAGKYQLHDLVQLSPETVGVVIQTEHNSLRVLDQNGTVRLVDACQISMRRDTRRVVAVDSEGHEIRVNDNMKETQGELREGRVLHIHQSHYAFLHNRGLLESGGVFVTRAMELVSTLPRFRLHESTIRRRNDLLSTPGPYVGGASPARNPGSWNGYSITPSASPYIGGSTPAWDPSSRTPVRSPRAGSETPASLPHSRLREYVFAGGETPARAVTEVSLDQMQMMDIDPLDDSSDPYEFAPDWLLELADSVDISTLRVRIKGTLEENYLNGKYESHLVHTLSTESSSSCFEHTALVRNESTSEECRLLMQYLVPDVPSQQNQLAVVLHESRQGEKVKVTQRPSEDMSMEHLVVESMTKDGPVFWECQKDWMCALW